MRALCSLLLLLLLAHPASAEMIKWVDANGTVHVSGSLGEVPPEFRTEAQALANDDERVHIIPKKPEPQESSGWFFGSSGGGETQPRSDASPSPGLPGLSFLQGLALVVVQFFASIFVLVACVVLIGERVEYLGGKAFGSIFAQRFLMFAAFLWISHSMAMNFVPHSASLGLAKVLIAPALAELGIMTVILRYTICDMIGRAAMLSVLFCAIDAMVQGLLFFGAVLLVS